MEGDQKLIDMIKKQQLQIKLLQKELKATNLLS